MTFPYQPTVQDSDVLADMGEPAYEISPDVIMLSREPDGQAEAIRTMRTHVMARHLHEGRRGLTVCAPNAQSGCTFTAVNLAVALSQIGVGTLLVDADLHAPSVQNYIRPLGSDAGLRQCIQSRTADPHTYIHPEILPCLSVLYSGGRADNPQELLGSDTFTDLIQRCLRDFDCTIVDSPPSNLYADARRISSLMGYGIIVARRNVALYSEVGDLAAQLQADGVGVVGTVLNEI